MSSRYVYETARAFLEANWVDTRIVETLNTFADDEVGGDPLTEWVEMLPGPAIEQQASVGSPLYNRWREEGILALTAFVPSGSGVARALELAEKLRDLFREQQIDDGSGGPTIVCRAVDPPDTTLPSSVQASSGNWFGFTVTVTYYADFCRQTN